MSIPAHIYKINANISCIAGGSLLLYNYQLQIAKETVMIYSILIGIALIAAYIHGYVHAVKTERRIKKTREEMKRHARAGRI